MKNKFIFVCVLTFVLTFTFCCIAYADDIYDSLQVGTTSPGVASDKEIAYRPITGTRYVFRINGEDIGTTKVGGLGSQNYYVNHVRNTTVSQEGLDYYNPSVSQEKKGVNNNRNWELVFVGYNNNNTIVFKGNKTKYYFFDTPASSLETYTSELNGEKQYRHVIVWRRGAKLKGNEKVVYNNNFGLNSSDIKKLVGAIRTRAEILKDEITLNQLSDIESGKVDFEIRAEILMILRMPTEPDYSKKLTGTTLIRDASDCYAYYKLKAVSYYTYREAAWILNDVNRKVGTTYYGAVHNHFGNVASQLYEQDDPYKTEYASESAASKVEGKSSVRSHWTDYYHGWDYLSFENPYQVDKTVVTETVKLINTDGSETTLSGPTETIITEDTTFTRPTNNYTYTGLEFDGGEKSLVISQLVEADNGTHEIIYWYEAEKKTTITINYKDEKTGENICPSEMVEPGTHSKKDFDGYEYTGLEIVKPNPEAKDPNKTSVTIDDNKETNEITFWYKPEEVTIVKVTHKSKGGQILQDTTSYTIKENGSSQTFSQIASAGVWKYVGVDVTCDGNPLKNQDADESVTISYNGSVTYEITFWYAMQIKVKIMGRCDGMSQAIYQTEASIEDLPLEKVYSEEDYTPTKGYEFLGEYEVKEGTLFWESKGSIATGNSVTLNFDEATTTPQQVLIVFYYESEYTLTVNHIYVDPITGDEKVKSTYSNLPITPGEKKSVSSIDMDNCLNLKYEPLSEVTAVGFTEYSKAQNNIYTLEFTPSENYTVNFYYTSQTITVKHIQNNKDIIEPTNKILVPTNLEEALSGYPFQKWVLNENKTELKTETGTKAPTQVSIKEGTPSQELIFYYQEPNLIFGPDDPNVDDAVDPDGREYGDMVEDYGTGITPNDLNNQKINQNASEYYWVLNQKGKLTVKFANTHLEKSSGNCKFTAEVEIPFDVYVNGNFYSAGASFKIGCELTKENDNGYDIHEGVLEDIYVPIWVTETDYTITGTVLSTYTSNDGSTKSTTSNATATVKVVGAVYDFTITNLDGSDTTGDTMWKKALFGTAEEYKATETAIGQGTQQPKNYSYGIKRGTRFYFSLNTLGKKSQKIVIVPTFYYINNKGEIKQVYMGVDANSKLKLEDKRTISLTDDNRTTDEFKKERAKKNKDTNATTFEIGDYIQIALDSNVNTPYLGIASELAVKYVKSDITLSDHANHWYGDYTIPNNAKFYSDEKKTNLISDESGGVIVVYFEIKTLDGDNAEYLEYDGYSPFVQTEKISEWDYERKSFGTSMFLPKTTGQISPVTSSDSWKQLKSTATIIYSLKSNVTTKQNVTSIGTH